MIVGGVGSRAPQEIDRSVNPYIQTKGGRLCPSYYLLPPPWIQIPNKYLGFGYKSLVFCRNNGWLMNKGLISTKMGADNKAENTSGSHMTTGSSDCGLLNTPKFCDIWPHLTLDRRTFDHGHLTTTDIWPRDFWPQLTFDRGMFDCNWHLTAGRLIATDIWPQDFWPQLTFDLGTFDYNWHLSAGLLTATDIWQQDVWPSA
jgi:hypothetical protein